MDAPVEIDYSKRKRHLSNEVSAPNMDLRVKLMGDSLKSRLGCEIDAFCSNIQSIVLRDSQSNKAVNLSPPQTVPRVHRSYTKISYCCDTAPILSTNSSVDVAESQPCISSRSLFNENEELRVFDNLDSSVSLVTNCEGSFECASQTIADHEESFQSEDEELFFLHCALMKLSLKLVNCVAEKFN